MYDVSNNVFSENTLLIGNSPIESVCQLIVYLSMLLLLENLWKP